MTLEANGMNTPLGSTAPDFSAEVYHSGKVKKIRLIDYRDQWVLLFFYPADFTQV